MALHRTGLTLALCLFLVGCFEDPVREQLHLSFIGGEAVVMTTVLEVADPDVAGSNPELAGRLDTARSEIEGGWDRWRPLYDQLNPVAERYSLERVDGLARRALYSALVPDFESVERFLGSEGISATLLATGSINELQLYPSGGTRATWLQHQEVDRRIDGWSEAVAEYLDATIDLFAYLETHSHRAIACFSHVFDIHGPESGPLDDREAELVKRVGQSTEEVAEILLVSKGDAFSTNELSRLAFDPFPARLTIAVRGDLILSEELVEGDGFLERPTVDLWHALIRLEGRWVSPDLVTAMVSPLPEDQQPESDPAAFAQLPRWFGTTPDAKEVGDGLREGLVPPDVHVVRWRSIGGDSPDLEVGDPRRYIEAAESNLPR